MPANLNRPVAVQAIRPTSKIRPRAELKYRVRSAQVMYRYYCSQLCVGSQCVVGLTFCYLFIAANSFASGDRTATSLFTRHTCRLSAVF